MFEPFLIVVFKSLNVLSMKRWISKSYSYCWKGFKCPKDAGKLKNLQDVEDFSEEQSSV